MRRRSLGLAMLLVAIPANAGFRLESDAVPRRQEVRLVLDPSLDRFTGEVRVEIDVLRETRAIRLHAQGPSATRATLTADTGSSLTLSPAAEGKDLLVLGAPEPVRPGRYRLEVAFEAAYNTRADSLYKVIHRGTPYLFTQFEDTAAREAFPCWDEPSYKIPWRITLTVPDGLTAISNAPIERESVEGAMRTVVFKATPPLPSYLVALAVGPFETVPVPGLDVPARIVTVKGQSGLAGEAVKRTPPLLRALERYFGQPYPFEKLDLIAVPDYWYGAMENPGAITFREELLLVDPAEADVAARRELAETVAHELAHMWFGDLVTMAWWDDLWLNESFASWMGNKVVQEVFPELRVSTSQVAGMLRAMDTDSRSTTRAIRQPVVSQDVLLQAADVLAYRKGEAVLGMFERWIGPEAFRKGVVDYLQAFAWKNATAADLWKSLSRSSRKEVGAAMSSFLDQPGVPIVDVRTLPGGRVKLTQRRFMADGSNPSPPVRWKIPVTLSYDAGSGRQTRSVLLEDEVLEVSLGKSTPVLWVHPNLDERGYYRWNLPAKDLLDWARHATERLNPRERIGLLGNLGALFEAGVISGPDYFALLAPMGDDPDPQVVSELVSVLSGLRGPFGDGEAMTPFASYVRTALLPAWRRIGAFPKEGERETAALLRPRLFGFLGKVARDPEVVSLAADLARRYLADPSAVPVAMAYPALEIAARTGDSAMFEQVRAKFEAATVPADRTAFLATLGNFRSPALVERALAYTLTGPLRPPETFSIPEAVGSDPELGGPLWEWMKSNYDALASRIPSWGLTFLPYFAGGCSLPRVEDAKTFFTAERDVPGTAKTLAKVVEGVQACDRLRRREGTAVLGYLRGTPGSVSSAGAASAP